MTYIKRVKIDSIRFVEVDGLNLTLKQPGKNRDIILGYFTNWEHVFNHLIRMYVVERMPENETITLCQLRTLYREVKKDISFLIEDMQESIKQKAVKGV